MKTSDKILIYIFDYSKQNGWAPSVREICKSCFLTSTGTVHGHLERLRKKKLLIKKADSPRAMRLSDSGVERVGFLKESSRANVGDTP